MISLYQKIMVVPILGRWYYLYPENPTNKVAFEQDQEKMKGSES